MKCARVVAQLSAWLDGHLRPSSARKLQEHLALCAACRLHADQLRTAIHWLQQGPAPAPPRELSWRLRVLASRWGAGQQPPSRWAGLYLRWQNSLRVLAMPAFAGMMGALTLITMLVGTVGMPLPSAWPAAASAARFSPPQVVSSPALNLTGNLFVVANIAPNGRVVEYQLLSGPRTRQNLSRLRIEMHDTVFRPALLAGRPIRGQALLNFSNFQVKG